MARAILIWNQLPEELIHYTLLSIKWIIVIEIVYIFNQVCTWFLIIVSVSECLYASVCVCVCVCVCPCPRGY